MALHAHPDDEIIEAPQRLASILEEDATDIRDGYTSRADITHRIDVGAFAAQRMTALAQHRSVLEGPGRFAKIAKTLRRIPAPLQARLFRWEWFAEEGRRPGPRGPLTDILDGA